MAELGALLSVSEFAFEGDDAALMRYLAGAEPSCRVWRACEGGGVRIDGATSTLPLESEVAVSTLRCTLSVPGAAAGTDAPFHYVVETDVPPVGSSSSPPHAVSATGEATSSAAAASRAVRVRERPDVMRGAPG